MLLLRFSLTLGIKLSNVIYGKTLVKHKVLSNHKRVDHNWNIKYKKGQNIRKDKCDHCDYRSFSNQRLQKHVDGFHLRIKLECDKCS